MSLGLVFDPLFRLPFLTGLGFAVVLPLLGAYLRLREEWLAALGLAQVAAAGGVLSLFAGLPALAAALLAAGIAAGIKGWMQRPGNDTYAVMILLGWSATLLLAANSPHGEELSHALMDGQLYFTGKSHLLSAGVLAAAVLILLPWLSPRLLTARFFPDHFSTNGLPGWRYHLGFDLLAAFGLALATAAIGVMAAFALVFIPPWLAFAFASGWRFGLLAAALLGMLAYLAAFALAVSLDQPFGPVLVAVLLLLAVLRLFAPRRAF